MKRALWIMAVAAICVLVAHVGTSSAQQQSSAPPQKSLSASLGVQVFPGGGQSASQQSKDESECYKWAVSNTGTDPAQLQQQQQQQAQAAQQNASSTQGSAAKGAAKGAAAGALIGGISGDAGEGAAVGAASGAAVSHRRAKKAQQQNSAAISSGQQATAEQMTTFKKAFSACLESKKYTVKF